MRDNRREADEVSPNVFIMRTVAQFDYLVRKYEQLSLDELKLRAQYCPGIIEEPELQQLVQICKDSTIKAVFRNSMGLWWTFE